ncbi:MAG TPA: thioredoxin domain-containing protein [Propionibacteriaceae bacterium]|nr:thioredoxin domain-containing protein [Propionibacteriaceae bacterium]
MANRLRDSLSPYLLLHAGDPVDWWEWGDEALAEAKRRDVPVFISVGYAACHWCHVMREESFADPEVAALLNESFVSVKVDREERPDVDAVYMQATQAMTGSGGWPMTVFATPEGRPFFAGTYFPPVRRGQMPSFPEVVTALADAWATRRDEVVGSSDEIVRQLAAATNVVVDADRPEPKETLELLSHGYDPIHGGFGRAPKFPPTTVLDALLVRGDPATLDLATGTLDAMARGGICDQAGGGFHRYSVDAGWVVPHFEKMLYDNALLLGTFARAWRRIPFHEGERRDLYEGVGERLVGWLLREMRLDGGAFASSLDADSADIHGNAHEGIFYVWNPELLVDALGDDDGDWARDVFHVTNGGTFEHGLSVLQVRGRPDRERLDGIRERLLVAREARFRPQQDDKVVAAWNGWLVDSLVQAGMIFQRPEWVKAARDAATYVWETHWVDGSLRRVSRGGVVAAEGAAADDHGAVALGFARLAGALGEGAWLERARLVLDAALELYGADDGGFYDAPAGDLYARARDVADNATPSGTATLVAALRLVSLLACEPSYESRADDAVRTTWAVLGANPRFAGWPLADLLVADEAGRGLRPAQVVVVTDEPGSELVTAAWRMAPDGSAVVVGAPGTEGFGHLFEGRTEPGVYVCRGETCFAPAADVTELKTVLWKRVH